MIDAILKGKVSRDIEQMEDMLTSSVFGALKYSNSKYLNTFIGKSVSLKDVELSKIIKINKIQKIIFWPKLFSEYCNKSEPDILIEAKSLDNKDLLFCVEAKLNSNKSSYPDDSKFPNDQLAREYDNLFFLAQKRNIYNFYLIYLTKDIAPPVNDMKISINEYRLKRNKSMELYWLNWQSLIPLIKECADNMLIDIYNLLLKLDLNVFEGIPTFRFFIDTKWLFNVYETVFQWLPSPTHPFNYEFKKIETNFNWDNDIEIKNNYKFRGLA